MDMIILLSLTHDEKLAMRHHEELAQNIVKRQAAAGTGPRVIGRSIYVVALRHLWQLMFRRVPCTIFRVHQ